MGRAVRLTPAQEAFFARTSDGVLAAADREGIPAPLLCVLLARLIGVTVATGGVAPAQHGAVLAELLDEARRMATEAVRESAAMGSPGHG